ncbi:hypothetical protein PR202_ga18688 [Eleusine coracana subsp. coracana]|uniref:Uncharacterized protein n=1 Tax=Eleusine coracana subsp. coracana TaxID=191504 RepID=A0AAV5CU68_ELECO|nr:hypothetical protein PR202_ga18688 [Eleusine coracana subsp. coracana]
MPELVLDGARHAVRRGEAAAVRDGAARRVPEVKAALGARGDVEWEECSDAMHGDVMKSVRSQVEKVVQQRGYVLLYQEIRDLCDGVVSMGSGTSATASCPRRPERLTDLDWDGLLAFHDAERAVGRLNAAGKKEELAGYVQRSGVLSHAVVYNGRTTQEAPMIFASTLPVMKRSSAVPCRGFDILYAVFVTTHKTGEHKTVMPDSLRLSLSCC